MLLEYYCYSQQIKCQLSESTLWTSVTGRINTIHIGAKQRQQVTCCLLKPVLQGGEAGREVLTYSAKILVQESEHTLAHLNNVA